MARVLAFKKPASSDLDEIDAYLEACQARLTAQFADKLSLPHMVQLQRKHLKKDFLRNIANTLYIPVYLFLKKFTFWFDEMGVTLPATLFSYFPPILKTGAFEEVEQILWDDVFQKKSGPLGISLSRSLQEFSKRRAEKSDLNTSLVIMSVGLLFFNHFDWSLEKLAYELANLWAREDASSTFIGIDVGKVLYDVKGKPETRHIVLSTLGVGLGFSLLIQAVGAGLTWIQIRTGVFHRKMHDLVEDIGDELRLECLRGSKNAPQSAPRRVRAHKA